MKTAAGVEDRSFGRRLPAGAGQARRLVLRAAALAAAALAALAAGPAAAAAALTGSWTRITGGTTANPPAAGFAKAAGTERVLVVAVYAEYGTARTTFTPTVSYGGQTVNRWTSTDLSSRQKVWIGWLDDAGIVAATGTPPQISVTLVTTNLSQSVVYAAFYTGVDQATPLVDGNSNQSDTAATSAPFGKTLAWVANGMVIYAANANGSTSFTPPNASYLEQFDAAEGTQLTATVAHYPPAGAGSANESVGIGASQRWALSVVSLRPGGATAAGTASASPSGCTSIAVSAPYTGDSNANNTLSWRTRTPSGTGTWTAPTAIPHSASPYAFTVGSLATGSTHDLEVSYLDADGVAGTAVQTISNVLVGGNCTVPGVAAAAQTPGATPSIAVSAPYTGDANATNTLSWRTRTPSGTGAWSGSTSRPHSASPYSFAIAGLSCGSTYDVEITFADADGIGTGGQGATQVVTGVPVTSCTTAGAPTATPTACDRIDLSAPFANDANGNGATLFERGTSASGPFAAAACGTAGSVAGASPRTCSDTGLAASTSYWYRVTYSDPDAVDGSAQQVIGGFATPACPAVPAPTPGTPTATVGGCNSITVSAPFTGDTNGTSTTSFGRSLLAAGPFTPVAGCTDLSGASPRTCVDGTVAAQVTYHYQVTFVDPVDGVNPPNPQVVSATTPQCGNDVTVAAGTMPAGATVAAGTVGTAVARISFVSTPAAATLQSLAVENLGNAQAGADVSSLGLYDDASGTFLASSTWDAGAARYRFQPLSVVLPTSPGKTLRIALNLDLGATVGRTFRARVTSPGDLTGGAADTFLPAAVAGNTFTVGAASVSEGNADPAAPMASILNPGKGTVLGTTFRLQVRVHNPPGSGGIAGVTAVEYSTDGGTTWSAAGLARNANHDTGTPTVTGTTYDASLTLSPGQYALVARAQNAAGPGASTLTTNSARVPVTVREAGTGDGNLLVRDDASQACTDCHALETHSSESTSTRRGAWATTCRDCHQPHGTRNVYLVAERIGPPAVNGVQATRNVGFTRTVGDSAAAGWDVANARPTAAGSFVNSDQSGPCQVCHTRTEGSGGIARWRNTGNADSHYTAAAGTQPCTNCHPHADGFGGGESTGGVRCSGCHGAIWQGMNGAVAKSFRHAIGAVPGTHDAPTDDGYDWSAAATLQGVPVSSRTCVNMCHADHPHDVPAVSATHEHNAYLDASTSATRANAPASGRSVANRARTDFDPAQANGGMCLSCHRKPLSAGRSGIDRAAYDASAHDYSSFGTYGAWAYGQHDGGTFDRNCTKCHADRADARPGDSGTPFGAVHYSDYPNLLSGSRNPAGTPAAFVCYGCHGDATDGADLSGKPIATVARKAYGHPVNADAVHDTAAEYAGAAYGNALGGKARHASCMDCHDPHRARAGAHAVGSNAAGPPLEGAWGAQLSSNPAFWSNPAAGNFTKKVIVAGTDLEATLCFKCHSAWYGTLPTSPSGGFAETDQAKEFNPANVGNFAGTWASGETAGGFHPVLATAGSNLGAVNLANLVTTNVAWSTTARNLMTCSDCHESDGATDPNGPHGSAAAFLLRGPNTGWSGSTTMTSTGMPANTFCANCHSATFASSRFATHYSRSNHRVACWNCHAAVPHGGPRPGMLVAAGGAAAGVGGVIAGWDQTAPYWGLASSTSKLYIASYPTNATTGWDQNNCGCNGTGH
ncbi:MAG TPA: NapC/NirT family cytochrome c [Anaeromyxobacteraceae bacterium]|nr:NapC/NirT family cytochrome c [Anaeromyxobacteraceae bacterium]